MIRLNVRQPACSSLLTFFCKDLEKRGLLELSHPPLDFKKKENALSTIPNVLYAGFDPTADSFHVGNLLIISNLLRASLFGCQPIALIGGATAQIGDPSGRSDDRIALPADLIGENAKNLLRQMVEIVENASEMCERRLALTIVNNMEWYDKMTAIKFLQIGRSFRVGEMLRIGPIKSRMVPAKGISYAEFSYPIFQSYDWYELARRYNCYFQLGGSDQLGNIAAGQEYVQRQLGALSFGACLPLVTDERGQKLGKSTIDINIMSPSDSTSQPTSTGGDGVWLDAARTSPFALYQYFRQLPDALAERLLLYYSLAPVEELDVVLAQHAADRSKWLAQSRLAEEMVGIVHGQRGLELAQRCSRIMFSGKLEELKELNAETIRSLFGEASTFRVTRRDVNTFGDLADRTCPEKQKRGAATMREGSFYVNGQKYLDATEPLHIDTLLIRDQFSVVSWGKRRRFLVQWLLP